MIALLLDALCVIAGGIAGLASVRLTGMVLNARNRRRHKRCLRNIERLEIANGYREAPATYASILRRQLYGINPIIEVKPGAAAPIFVPGTTFDVAGRPIAPAKSRSALQQVMWEWDRPLQALATAQQQAQGDLHEVLARIWADRG